MATLILLIVGGGAGGGSAGAQGRPSPVGFWNTISDVDGRAMSVVEIRQAGDQLVGIVRALLVPADPEDSVCGKCTGARKGQPIVGMDILHVHADGDEWHGEVLDPESGKVYRATVKLGDRGRTLILRGYIGIPLFGRSQTWVRRANPL